MSGAGPAGWMPTVGQVTATPATSIASIASGDVAAPAETTTTDTATPTTPTTPLVVPDGREAVAPTVTGAAAAVAGTPPSGWRRAWRRVAQSPPVRAARAQTLTGPGGVVLAVLLLAPWVLVDLATDATFGAPSTVGVLLAGVMTALVVRTKALATAAVLPPLLFVGSMLTLAQLSGLNRNPREVVLDAGTTLALSAPALFAGTGVTLAVVLGRLLWGTARR